MKGQTFWYGFGLALLIFALGLLLILGLPLKELERTIGIIALLFISGMILVMSMPRE